MKKYTIYHKDFAPTELVAKYPNHAKYYTDEFCLFVETLEQVTGTPHADISTLYLLNLVEDNNVVNGATEDDEPIVTPNVSDETQITKSDLLARVNAYLIAPAKHVETQLSEAQGRFIYKELFSDEA